MSSLSKAQPSALAESAFLIGEILAQQNQIQEETYTLAAENTKIQGSAAQAFGNSAYNTAYNQSQATMQQGYASISQGSFTCGGELSGWGVPKMAFGSQINAAQSAVDNATAWETQVQKLANPEELAKIQARGNANGQSVQPGALKHEDFTKAVPTDDQIQQIAMLKSANPKDYSEFAENVQNQKKSAENRLSNLQNEQQKWEHRIQTLSNSGSYAAQGGFQATQANIQMSGASLQQAQQLAQFVSTTSNATQQMISGQLNSMNQLNQSTTQSLINGLTQQMVV